MKNTWIYRGLQNLQEEPFGNDSLCTQYCTTINKYVFYSKHVSEHHCTSHSLEFTNNYKLNFYNLIKYLKDEQKNNNLSSLSGS